MFLNFWNYSGSFLVWFVTFENVFAIREGLKKIKLKKLAFDQKGGGGVGTKTNMLILFFIFLQTMNIASRLLDSWRTLKRNHISTIPYHH